MSDIRAGIDLLVAVTSGTSGEVDLTGLNLDQLTFYIEWAGTVTVGTVVLETADRVGYTGAWHQMDSKVGAANSQQMAQFTGFYRAIRARVSVAVVGGTVSVRVKGK